MNELTKRILVVEDDAALRDLVLDYLNASGFRADGVGDGCGMRDYLQKHIADLVVLDLMLPGEDGLSLLRWLRENRGPPVIIASARGDEIDRVVGLELGSDDYLAKPYGPRELLARIRAVLRRTLEPVAARDEHTLSFGAFRLHLTNHVLMRGEEEIALTSGEFNLLRILLEHPNQVLTRDHLIALLKGYERSPYDRSIDVRVTRLRRKIESEPDAPIHLRTVWGEGYLFSPQGRDSH